MRRLTIASLVLALSAATACARGLYGPSVNTPVKDTPREIDELSVDERKTLLDRASVWRPIETARLDLLKGPDAADALPLDEQVTCTFAYPDKPLDGVTPKFECEVAPKDVVKVKYGADNGEVFAEVAGSRLFWALGFYADRMYPVKVVCVNCPKDPHRASAAEWHLGRPGNVSTHVFDPAAIERKFKGDEIEVPGFEGWSWLELEAVADNSAGATRAQIDALKLLAAFIQHVDSKPDNQALMCEDGAVRRDRQGNETCAQPILIVKDLGSSFAEASKINFEKMKLNSWESADIWRDEKGCQANLTSSFVGTLEHPVISEAGRQFLATRLSLLSDRQIRDLFTAARVERRGESIDGRPVTADDWARVFKAKRDQIVNHRCST